VVTTIAVGGLPVAWDHPRVTPPGEILPGRRQVLRTVAVAAAAAATTTVLAGCLPGDDEPEPPDPELLLRARVADEVRALAGRYAATVERFPGARAELATLGAEHEEHARALLPRHAARALASATAGATATESRSTSPGPAPSPTPAVPSTLPAARAELAEAEGAASRRRLGQLRRMPGGSPELARLLASVAACEAAHAALLSADA